MSKVHVRTGDTVVVLSGKNKGQQGKVVAVTERGAVCELKVEK